MSKWIAEFDLEDGDTMPEHMDLEYKGAKIDFHCKPLEQEPCEDAVSRKAILDKIKEVCFSKKKEWIDFRISQGSNGQRNLIINFIEELPSVTPTRKKGKWEYVGDNCFKCSECGEVYTVDQFNHINNYCDNRFPKGCPNCGSFMMEED